MSRLSPSKAKAEEVDPRRQPDAYILHLGNLYEVIREEQSGPASGRLHVRNCLTLHPLWLTTAEVDASELVRAAPDPDAPDADLAVPDFLAKETP